jgi:hypothetical protein
VISVFSRIARWWDPGKPIRRLLQDARALLPGDTPNPVIDSRTDECRLKHFDEFIEHNELGLALDSLVYIADACSDDGQVVPAAFWKTLSQAAEIMQLTEEARACRAKAQAS